MQVLWSQLTVDEAHRDRNSDVVLGRASPGRDPIFDYMRLKSTNFEDKESQSMWSIA